MFPFWESVVAPVMRASGAKRVVEIGALRGENTALVVGALEPDAELHVIDPVPEFDPSEHERQFPGRYVFHRDLSLNVLGEAGAFDVALVDGDHNWYTVYNELRALARTARAAGQPLPVLILHDVCWPYGRRDLYYAPEQIPEEFRQPYERLGMRPGTKRLLPSGGMNTTLDNAAMEGGPRNGVMTALDDFIAEHDRPLRRLVIPIYFGLAIVVEEERLARTPALRALLDQFESVGGRQKLLELSEKIRLDEVVFTHNYLRHKDGIIERGARRYLDLLTGALLDEHYLENEVRISYLAKCARKGELPGENELRDPVRFLRDETRSLRLSRRSGETEERNTAGIALAFTTMGRARLEFLERLLHDVRDSKVAGDFVECGVGRGGGGVFLRGFLEAYELPQRTVWVADPFRSVRDDASNVLAERFADLNQVREAFDRFGLLDERVRFLQGEYDDTLADAPIDRIALLHVGSGVGKAVRTILDECYERLSSGGFVVIDEYTDPDVAAAVDAFRSERAVTTVLERPDWSSVAWRKDDDTPAGTAKAASGTPARAPLAPPAPVDAIDLTVVVVFYNMKREAQRTLHSLTRAYQNGVDDLDYEVIVVENGSDPSEKLGEEFVRGFGPEFRYVDMGGDAAPSPTGALNRGVRLGRGRAFALMIDGAHVLSPGVLRYGMAGLDVYRPAVVATQQWYIGPGQQPDVVAAGYDERSEDELFESVGWPSDGYSLFEISHFIGDRDWLDGLLESNCLFVPRSLLEQVGGFDESFSMPGGGYANLDLYERLASAPDVTVATILGEGSFHQVHGGTTTNHSDPEARRNNTFSYGEHYQETRGRLMRGPVKAIHYVGALSVRAARRSRSRRMTALAFAPGRIGVGPDGRPETPSPIPDEIRTSFVEAFWYSLAWTKTTWLGRTVPKAPTDLMAYQELVERVRPDWIVETGTGNGGRALFLASICELIGQGNVISLDERHGADLPRHPRLTYVTAKPDSDEASARVRELTGDAPRALVVLGSRLAVPRTIAEFDAYSPLVPVGSYVVVEDTVLNGRPVWPGFGPGPAEAVNRLLSTRGDFAADPAMEKFGLTFNPNGFLKRIK